MIIEDILTSTVVFKLVDAVIIFSDKNEEWNSKVMFVFFEKWEKMTEWIIYEVVAWYDEWRVNWLQIRRNGF